MSIGFVISKKSCNRLVDKSYRFQKWQIFLKSDRRGVFSITGTEDPFLLNLLLITKPQNLHLLY